MEHETGNINTVLCPIKVNSNTIELTVPTSCYWVLDLLCVKNCDKIAWGILDLERVQKNKANLFNGQGVHWEIHAAVQVRGIVKAVNNPEN